MTAAEESGGVRASLDAAFRPDRWWTRLTRLVVAGLILAAVGTNTVDAVSGASDATLAQLYSYFTIHSNLLLAAAFLIGVARPRWRPEYWNTIRGAIAFYMVMTGIIYVVLIAPPAEFLEWKITWTGMVEHRIGPWAAFLDWLLVPLVVRAGWRRPLLWLAYPILFLVLTWARGGLTGWYPYHFLDPAQAGGWGGVATLTGVVVAAFLIVAVALHLVGQWRAPGPEPDPLQSRLQPG